MIRLHKLRFDPKKLAETLSGYNYTIKIIHRYYGAYGLSCDYYYHLIYHAKAPYIRLIGCITYDELCKTSTINPSDIYWIRWTTFSNSMTIQYYSNRLSMGGIIIQNQVHLPSERLSKSWYFLISPDGWQNTYATCCRYIRSVSQQKYIEIRVAI